MGIKKVKHLEQCFAGGCWLLLLGNAVLNTKGVDHAYTWEALNDSLCKPAACRSRCQMHSSLSPLATVPACLSSSCAISVAPALVLDSFFYLLLHSGPTWTDLPWFLRSGENFIFFTKRCFILFLTWNLIFIFLVWQSGFPYLHQGGVKEKAIHSWRIRGGFLAEVILNWGGLWQVQKAVRG